MEYKGEEVLPVYKYNGYCTTFRALDQLKWLRDTSGLRNWQLAERLGVSRSTVCRMQHSMKADPTLKQIERFANACGFSLTVTFTQKCEEKVRYSESRARGDEQVPEYHPRYDRHKHIRNRQ